MKFFFGALILICMCYFVGGWFAVAMGLVTRDDYFAYAGIVGSLATVAGLLALTRPAINASDLQAIETKSLKSIAETAEQLQVLQDRRSKAAEEIDNLQLKKKEMELLVKKASLALFLREQKTYFEKQVLDELSRNAHLQQSVAGVVEASQKLQALNEEIDSDPHVDELKGIIESATTRTFTIEEVIGTMPPISRAMFHAFSALNEVAKGIVKRWR